MSFLSRTPVVFAISDRYEIAVNFKYEGICSITVGDKEYFSEVAGIKLSEQTFHKISVPMAELDSAKKYTVNFRRTVIKRSYFPVFEKTVSLTFEFKPILNKDKINAYHLADVHYNFEKGVNCAKFFGDNLDLLIVNGDIGEVEEEKNFTELYAFLADITGGKIPVIFTRGNHDTRGVLAYRFPQYFPTENGNHYYTTSLGDLFFIILDCGEDKNDDHPEYNSVNLFKQYREKQIDFIKNIKVPTGKTPICITHMCPGRTSKHKNDIFNIDLDVYAEWVKGLNALKVKLMIAGHTHKAEIIKPNGAVIPHDYPILIGSQLNALGKLYGTAITFENKKAICSFTDDNCKIKHTETIDL